MPNIARMLKKAVLPALGTAIAGPIGGFVGSAASGVLGKTVGGAIGKGVGSAVQGLGNAYAFSSPGGAPSAGRGSTPNSRKWDFTPKQAYGHQKNLTQMGADIDRQSSIDQFQDRYQFLRDEGATLTEAMGLGTGSTAQGGTTTMGNAAGQQAIAGRQMAFQEEQAALDRAVQIRQQDTNLAASQISAQASVDAAQVGADASRYGTDQQAENVLVQAAAQLKAANISAGATITAAQTAAVAQFTVAQMQAELGYANLDLKSAEFQQVTLQRLAMDLQVQPYRVQEMINKVNTGSPAFIMNKLMYSMGKENLQATLLAVNAGIKLDDPSTYPEGADMDALLMYIAGVSSNVLKETSGAAVLTEAMGKQTANAASGFWNSVKEAFKPKE